MPNGQETEIKNPPFRYGSVCSAIEAATVAWHPLGWEPAFFAEIEPFPSAVLSHHYPHVPNFGDMTKFVDWPDATINLLVGGTPCQSFSVAGLRQGLADPRGNLALTYLAVADRYRPEWLVWENVPGVLSSNGGRDFGAFLGGLGELGYGFAYRVLDAQYVRVDGFGRAVPQRRRRVFVVGYLGDWRPAAAVLLERESMSRAPEPSRSTEVEHVVAAIKGAAIGRKPENGPQYSEHLSDGTVFTLNCTERHAIIYAEGDGFVVRYLAPSEYERLQGFPDQYTLVPYRSRLALDGPRYKALGNSMAVNVMRWIGCRIDKVQGIIASEPQSSIGRGEGSNLHKGATSEAERGMRRG